MNKNKKGFTLSEVLLVITILGFVITLCMKTMRNIQSSYTLLTYSAYNTVRDLVNAARGTDNALFECKVDNSIKKVFKITSEGNTTDSCDTKLNSGEGSATFCDELVKYANIKGSENCSAFFDTGINSTTKEPFMNADFSSGAPNFTLTNGMRVYISKHKWDTTNVSANYGYRLIAVDLNGTKQPNERKEPNSTQITDIVTFIVLDDGLVLPLAQAADNAYINASETVTYMNAYVRYFYNDTATNDLSDLVDECNKQSSVASQNVACFSGATTAQKRQCCERARKYTTHASDSTHILAPSGTSLTQKEKDSFSNKSVFSFREAYCKSHNNADHEFLTNTKYCKSITTAEYNRKNYLDKEARKPDTDITDNINRYDKLPQCKDDYSGATKRSKCEVQLVKPAFRYDL